MSDLFYGPQKPTFFAIENEGKESEYGNTSVSVCNFCCSVTQSCLTICDPMKAA